MNEYDEHTWTAEQRSLDGRIAADVESLGGSRYTHVQAGGALDDWLRGAQDTARAIRAQVARLTHAKRRAYWETELEAFGLPPAAPAAKPAIQKPTTGGKASDG